MKSEITLNSTNCAICGSKDNAVEVYPANFSLQDFNPEIFSARRVPDKIHYRIVKCQTCGLVRSDPIIDPDTLYDLYAKSIQTYDDEVLNLMNCYVIYLNKAVNCLSNGSNKEHLLEIGCGSGFFLEKALEFGFKNVTGVEPSHQAVEKSSPMIKPHLICDVFRPGLLPEEQFDLVCMFQVFDHINEPGMLLDECMKILKPGGGILIFNHDVRALTAKIMGENSPIIDIEHTYLYDQSTIKKIVSQHGFLVKQISAATNIVSLRYLIHLLPIQKKKKEFLLSKFQRNPIGKKKIPLKLGNLCIIAQKNKDD
jgi:SAM-dependent methyltransferase